VLRDALTRQGERRAVNDTDNDLFAGGHVEARRKGLRDCGSDLFGEARASSPRIRKLRRRGRVRFRALVDDNLACASQFQQLVIVVDDSVAEDVDAAKLMSRRNRFIDRLMTA
jgi:hypothetical protein